MLEAEAAETKQGAAGGAREPGTLSPDLVSISVPTDLGQTCAQETSHPRC